MRKALIGWSALAAALVFSVASYPRLPSRVPVHWNIEFEVDDSGPRWVVALLIPSVLMLMPVVAWALSRIDPRRSNYERHRVTYWTVWNGVFVLLAVLQCVIVALGLGWDLDSARVFPFTVGAFLVLVGNVSPRLRPNWFVGFRTPWALSSDEVWRKTHRLGGRMFVVAGALLVIAALQPVEWVRSALWPAAIVIAALVPAVYSYVEWRRLGRPERPATA